MSTVSDALRGFSQMNAQLIQLNGYLGDTLTQFEQMEQRIREAEERQRELSERVRDTAETASILDAGLERLSGALSLENVLGFSDSMTQAALRLEAVNDGLQTAEELQKKVMTAAQGAKMSYLDMAEAVANMDMEAGRAFSSNDEMIAFTEQAAKQFALGGASAEMQAAAMESLTGAMAAGALTGEELNAVLSAAPQMGSAIEESMGWAEGSIQEFGEKGMITADALKYALFSTAQETNEAFANMPATWGGLFNQFTNRLISLAQPVLSFISLLAENWSLIEPLIWGAITAIAAYGLVMAAGKAATLASAAASAFHTAMTGGWTIATFLQTAAQDGLNAALMSCPIAWIVMGIIALIAIFYAAVAAVNKFAGTSLSATGLICGALAAAGAFIANVLITAYNFLVDCVVGWYNLLAAFANFFANLLNDPAAAIVGLLTDLADAALGILGKIAKGIDALFGTNFSAKIGEWQGALNQWADLKFKDRTVEVMTKLHAEDFYLEKLDYGAAWQKGYNWGENLLKGSPVNGMPQIPGVWDGNENVTGPLEQTAANTGRIANSMSVEEEDVKYLRDIAEREAINRFTTAELSVTMQTTATINSDLDIDGIVSQIEDKTYEVLLTAVEGV